MKINCTYHFSAEKIVSLTRDMWPMLYFNLLFKILVLKNLYAIYVLALISTIWNYFVITGMHLEAKKIIIIEN